jgi:hypothetical protein
MIYEFLDLPPDQTNTGFAMSCSWALEEILEASVKQHGRYLRVIEEKFFEKTSHKAIIPQPLMNSSFKQMRNLLNQVPTSLAHMMSSDMQLTAALCHILELFYPVFVQSFDTVIIAMTDGPNMRSLRHELSRGGFTQLDMRHQIDWLSGSIKRGLRPTQTPNERSDVQLFPTGLLLDLAETTGTIKTGFRQPNVYLLKPVRTKRMAMAWDCRKLSGIVGLQLAGVRYGAAGAEPRFGSTAQDAAASRTEFYQLASEDRLVGETRLISRNRWKLSGRGEVDALLWRHHVDEHRYNCFADGIGRELVPEFAD